MSKFCTLVVGLLAFVIHSDTLAQQVTAKTGGASVTLKIVQTYLPGDRFRVECLGDNTGQIWATTRELLAQWDAESRTWKPTPVYIAKHPWFGGVGNPPWYPYQWPIRVFKGRNGSILAVVVCDAYQYLPSDAYRNGAWTTAEAKKTVDAAATEHGGPYWLEVWLYADGKWSAAQPLLALLTRERQFIVDHFAEQTPTPHLFDLQVVGHDLWWTDSTSVNVLDAAGRLTSWTLPKPNDRYPRFHPANLVLLKDGTLWHANDQGVMSLKLVDNTIRALPQRQLAIPEGGYGEPVIHVARDARVCMYREASEGDMAFMLRDWRWAPLKDLREFKVEAPDGSLWFKGKDFGDYEILKGETRLKLTLPDNVYGDQLTVVNENTLLSAGGQRLFLIERVEQEPGWALKTTLSVPQAYERHHVWVDKLGNFVGSGWFAPGKAVFDAERHK